MVRMANISLFYTNHWQCIKAFLKHIRLYTTAVSLGLESLFWQKFHFVESVFLRQKQLTLKLSNLTLSTCPNIIA